MEYWHDKDNGGFESVSGVPYVELACKKCHIAGCDVRRKKETDDILSCSIESVKDQELCLKCHSREKTMVFKINQARNEMDVHFANGMQCTDCHTAKEMHGDGTIQFNETDRSNGDQVRERPPGSLSQQVPHCPWREIRLCLLPHPKGDNLLYLPF